MNNNNQEVSVELYRKIHMEIVRTNLLIYSMLTFMVDCRVELLWLKTLMVDYALLFRYVSWANYARIRLKN